MSRVLELKELERDIERKNKRVEELRKSLGNIGKICELVRKEAEKNDVDLFEVAVALVPDLEKRLKKPEGGKSGEGKIRRTRKTKRYVNPHTNETLDTKGGNNLTLKSWRAEYGDEVDTWYTILE